jgi:hypothetical protein
MPRSRSLAFVVVMACGGPTQVSHPEPHPIDKTPTPPRARWVFASPARELRAKLDIGDHQTLYAGEHGRRELDKGDGKLVHAEMLAGEGLQAVLRDDKGRFVFVAADGDTYVSTEPLGPIARVSAARTEALHSVTAGRRAILGLSNGALVRSSDLGVTWQKVVYASQLAGVAASVALDSKGNGLLVHLPQRLFTTRDDGVTWTPVVSPPYGAYTSLHDGADRLFVVGYRAHSAVLDGDKLITPKVKAQPIFGTASADSDDEEEPITSPRLSMRMPRPPGIDEIALDEPAEEQRVLAGDHVVGFRADRKKVEVRSAPLGQELGTPSTPDALQHAGAGARFVAYGRDIVYLHPDDDADAGETKESKPVTTTILRSKDFGVSWQKDAIVPGVPVEKGNATIVAGPRGWLYVSPLCPVRTSSECSGMKPPKIRPAGKQAFEDLYASFAPHDFVFDEPRGKVYALAPHDDGHVIVYEGTLDGSKLSPTKLLDADRDARVTLTVDGDGTLRAFEEDARYLTMRRRNETLYIAAAPGKLAFAGRRGLLISEHEALETSDAGDTWTRVPSNGRTRTLSCSDAGCLLDATRVGWDLPAVQSTDVIRASSKSPEDKPTPVTLKPRAVTITKVTCKTSSKPSATEDVSWVDGTGPVRWATTQLEWGTGALSIVWGTKDAAHRAQLLLGIQDSTGNVRTGFQQRDEGVIGARYRFAPRNAEGKLSPVSVDLAWWSAMSQQVRRGSLRVSPFRVSRNAVFSGSGVIVDGGVLFQGARTDVIHFVHDDGKVETLASPGVHFLEAWHAGKKWVVADADEHTVELASSDDGGKTWALHGWAFGYNADHVTAARYGAYGMRSDGTLETIGGKLTVRASDGGTLYDVAWPIAADPPAAVRVDDMNMDNQCDPTTTGTMVHRTSLEGDSPVTMELDKKTFKVSDRVHHDTSSGKPCTAAYIMEDDDRDEAYLYPDKGTGWSGWLYNSSGDKTVIQPLVCQ